jgi:ABC-type transport system substrate-binding protein
LIAQSGTSGMKVTVWGWQAKRGILDYFVALLRRLGYDSSLRVYPDFFTYARAEAGASKRAQMGINGWAADFGTPSNFALLFRCDQVDPTNAGVNLSRFCDRRIEDGIDAATSAGAAAANTTWPKVYCQIGHAAPVVPLVNRRVVSLVSKRVGNYENHPMWGPLLDQMWVR